MGNFVHLSALIPCRKILRCRQDLFFLQMKEIILPAKHSCIWHNKNTIIIAVNLGFDQSCSFSCSIQKFGIVKQLVEIISVERHRQATLFFPNFLVHFFDISIPSTIPPPPSFISENDFLAERTKFVVGVSPSKCCQQLQLGILVLAAYQCSHHFFPAERLDSPLWGS